MAWRIFGGKAAALRFKKQKDTEGYITTMSPSRLGYEVHYYEKKSMAHPSKQYADILKVLPEAKRRKVAEYVDEVYHLGDPVSNYGVKTWKELVQHLVEFGSGTPYVTDRQPIADYLTYWNILEGGH